MPTKLSTKDNDMITVFSALGDATRLRLYKILKEKDEICVSSMADVVGISPAGASQHLKIMEKAGLIIRNRYGQKVCYVLNKENDLAQKVDKIL